MIFYEDVLGHPEAEMAILLRQFKSVEKTIEYADWVLTHLAEKEETKAFWRAIIERLKQ